MKKKKSFSKSLDSSPLFGYNNDRCICGCSSMVESQPSKLVVWVRFPSPAPKQAQSHDWGYVWGSYGEVLTQKTLNSKAKQYPDEVGSKADFIKTHWLGRRTADCIGLIKGYGWLNTQTGTIEYGTNGMPNIGADTMFNNANEKGTIDTLPEIPGLALWHSGHIGIYIGDGKVIHAANTHAGVIISDVSGSGFTHWLKIPYISYSDDAE